MFCRHCGEEIDDRSEYCRFCGVGQEEEAEAAAVSKVGWTVKKKRLVWAVSGAGALLIAVLAVILLSYRSPLSRFQSAIESGEAETAAAVYKEEIRPDDVLRPQAVDFVSARAARLAEAYQTEADYEALRASLQVLRDTGICKDDVVDAITELDDAFQTDQLLRDTEGYLREESLSQAVGLLERLRPGNERYKKTRTLLKELRERYVQEIAQKIDAALAQGEYEKAQDYVSLYYEKNYTPPDGYTFEDIERRLWEARADERRSMLEKYGPERPVIVESVRYVKVDGIDADFVEILFRNNSDLPIYSFSFSTVLPDGYGGFSAGSWDAILSSTYSYADSYYVPGYFEVVHPIQPGEVYGEGVYWYAGPARSGLPELGEVEACVQSVSYYTGDGEIMGPYEDPYYGYWLEEKQGVIMAEGVFTSEYLE